MSHRILFFPDGTFQIINATVGLDPDDYALGTYCHTPHRALDGASVWVKSTKYYCETKYSWRVIDPNAVPAELKAQALLLA